MKNRELRDSSPLSIDVCSRPLGKTRNEQALRWPAAWTPLSRQGQNLAVGLETPSFARRIRYSCEHNTAQLLEKDPTRSYRSSSRKRWAVTAAQTVPYPNTRIVRSVLDSASTYSEFESILPYHHESTPTMLRSIATFAMQPRQEFRARACDDRWP